MVIFFRETARRQSTVGSFRMPRVEAAVAAAISLGLCLCLSVRLSQVGVLLKRRQCSDNSDIQLVEYRHLRQGMWPEQLEGRNIRSQLVPISIIPAHLSAAAHSTFGPLRFAFRSTRWRRPYSTVIAKFHYTDPTGPDRTRTDPRGIFCGQGLRETPLGPRGSPTKSVRVRAVPVGSV